MALRRVAGVALRLSALVSAVAVAACRPQTDSGTLTIDGSTTAYPIVSAMGEDFGGRNPDVQVVVNRSGTGSGFQKFARGEIEIATASRPIKPEEDQVLRRAGVGYLALPIAYDGVSVIVNPQNSWASRLTIGQLRRAWSPGSQVRTWRDLDPSYPDERINFYGPTDNHGTFEFFTETIVGHLDEIRADYLPNPEYTAIIQAVAGDRDGMAYVGFSYYDTNRDKVKAVAIDGVLPTEDSIRGGQYVPLARPLYLYVSSKSLRDRPAVRRFLDFATSAAGIADVTEACYVSLPDAAYAHVRRELVHVSCGANEWPMERMFVASPSPTRTH